jgi:hypothetical protein
VLVICERCKNSHIMLTLMKRDWRIDRLDRTEKKVPRKPRRTGDVELTERSRGSSECCFNLAGLGIGWPKIMGVEVLNDIIKRVVLLRLDVSTEAATTRVMSLLENGAKCLK